MTPLEPARRVFGNGTLPLAGQLRRAVDRLPDRHATKEGKQVVQLRVRDGDLNVVEATVFPPNSRGEAVGLAPFTFTTPEAAREFVEEATVALEYLGCDVS
jgi:hypothetical protein